MRRPNKKAVDFLRLSLNMTGIIGVNGATSELILVVQDEMKRLGGNYSLRDAARIEATVKRWHDKDQAIKDAKQK